MLITYIYYIGFTIQSVSIHFTLVMTISHLLLDETQWNPLHETVVQAGTSQCSPQQKSVIKEQRQRKKETSSTQICHKRTKTKKEGDLLNRNLS